MAELIDLAVTAAGNNTRSGPNWPENMQFRQVNDAGRELEAMIAREYRDRNMSIAASGSSNAFAITSNQTITGYTDNLVLGFTANHTITGPATLNVNGLGAKSITAQDGSALGRNDIVNTQKVLVVYKASAGAFQLVGGRVAGSSADVLARIVKVGTVMAWPTATAPSGWLHCNGAAVSRTTYAELYAEIGTTYGIGDGSTTFNLPNYAGEFLRGWDNARGADPDRASRTDRGDGTTGDSVGTKQAAGTASHSHSASLSVTGTTDTQGAHAHNYSKSGDSNQSVGSQGNFANRSLTTQLTDTQGAHTHSVTGTAAGTTGLSGGNETRPRNVTVMWIILASPAAASASTLGVAGFSYAFDSGTADANPGSGKLRFNNATLSSANAIYISETDGYGAPLGAAIQSLPVNTSLYIYKIGSPGTYALYTMGATATDAGDYDKLTSLTYVSHYGTFSNGDNLAVVPFRAGATGGTGPQGADGGIRWTFDTSTTMGDPGSGDLRLNNATFGSVTEFAISANNAESGNPDISDWVAAWDDSTTTGNRGQIIIRKATATQNYIILNLTSAITDNTTWLTGTVSVAASNGSFSAADQLLVSFHRSGDKGLDGSGSGTVTSVTAGDGLSASGVGSTAGSFSATGTLTTIQPVNAQTGTTYTVVTGDNGKLVTFANASSVAVTLPQATSTFGAGWRCTMLNKGAGTVSITPTTSTIGGASVLRLLAGERVHVVSDGTNYQAYTTVSDPVEAPIRLTLSSGVPFPTTTIAATGTLYATPYGGRRLPVYVNNAWTTVDFAETSIALSAGTASRPNDVFAYASNGTAAFELLAWTSDTARATALVWNNGLRVKSGDATRLWVGTVYLDGSKQAQYTFGSETSGGGAAQFDVYNAFNRVAVRTQVIDSASSWTRAQGTVGVANSGGTGSGLNNRATFVMGSEDDSVDAEVFGVGIPANSGGTALCLIGVDSTSTKSGLNSYWLAPGAAVGGPAFASYTGRLLGRHYIQRLEEAGSSAGTTTFVGVAFGARTGLTVTLRI